MPTREWHHAHHRRHLPLRSRKTELKVTCHPQHHHLPPAIHLRAPQRAWGVDLAKRPLYPPPIPPHVSQKSVGVRLRPPTPICLPSTPAFFKRAWGVVLAHRPLYPPPIHPRVPQRSGARCPRPPASHPHHDLPPSARPPGYNDTTPTASGGRRHSHHHLHLACPSRKTEREVTCHPQHHHLPLARASARQS